MALTEQDLGLEGMQLLFDADDGVAVLRMALPGRVNKINRAFALGLSGALDAALALPGLKGLVIASAHKDFCVGADIDGLFALRDPAEVLQQVQGLNALFRRLETCGKPVVAALTGSALGGGYELALACHWRVALDSPAVQVGLPEVNLGVIPGAGGTQRLPYRVGLQAAMMLIAQAQTVRAPKALGQGLVDELAPTPEAVLAQARAWIAANPAPRQPWDSGAAFPGGVQPGTEAARSLFVGAAAFLFSRTAGAFPAAEAVVSAISDGTRLKFDRALEVESRLFAKLATSDQAHDMIRTLWYGKNAADRQQGQPQVEDERIRKVAVLGAGMMGAGLAWVCAEAGYSVVVRDIRQQALDAARAHITTQAEGKRHLSAAARQALVDRITLTLELEPVRGADLVIEAVVEDVDVKHRVIREVEALLGEDAIFASNTSAIPIGLLNQASVRPANFIGLHFFSPVEKMLLLELIQPPQCSQETLARSLRFGRRIQKTCVVVNDGYGFYTTRLFAAYLLEGCQLVAEGHSPALIEWAARTVGMVMPPLKVFDEVTLTLGVHAFTTREKVTGQGFDLSGLELVRELVALGRTGKAAGAGFYDWERRRLWDGLAGRVQARPAHTGLHHLQRRLLIAQAAEVGRALDDGVLRQSSDADVAAILGLGFAPNTGGPLSWMDRQGLPALVQEMDALAAAHGPRYAPSATLRRMAAAGERFYPG